MIHVYVYVLGVGVCVCWKDVRFWHVNADIMMAYERACVPQLRVFRTCLRTGHVLLYVDMTWNSRGH